MSRLLGIIEHMPTHEHAVAVLQLPEFAAFRVSRLARRAPVGDGSDPVRGVLRQPTLRAFLGVGVD